MQGTERGKMKGSADGSGILDRESRPQERHDGWREEERRNQMHKQEMAMTTQRLVSGLAHAHHFW